MKNVFQKYKSRHEPGQRTAIHEVIYLMRVKKLAETSDEIHALLAATLDVDQYEQRSHRRR